MIVFLNGQFVTEEKAVIASVHTFKQESQLALAMQQPWEMVIVDEAHSSQTGETAGELKAILGAKVQSVDGEEEADTEDILNQVMLSRGRQPNLSFFAFTATPKGKTLELFGRTGASGKPEAFHLYSMRQAIEEGFILDVLKNYTSYKTYYRLVKEAEDDPNLPKKKGVRALARFMSLHPHNIEQKTEVMVEHFRRHVKHRLHDGGNFIAPARSAIQISLRPVS